MELEHMVLRRLEYHSGTFQKPDMDIFVQTRREGKPVPSVDKLREGQPVWLKWVGGPIVAKGKIKTWQDGSLNDGDINKIRMLTEGTGLYDINDYWDDLKEKGPNINFIVVRVMDGVWLQQPIYPKVQTHQNWIYIDSEEKRKAWLENSSLSPKISSMISKGIRFDVFRRDNFTCQYCGRRPPEVQLEIDHKVPKAHGGSNSIENLVTACSDCNRGKRDKLI